MYKIIAQNITKTYSNGTIMSQILRGIDLQVKTGEFLAIMGKSGAGKSTLLYQIAALDRPDSGEIMVDDTNILNMNQAELAKFRLHTLGYVFQDYALMPTLTAEENVLLPLLMKKIDWPTALAMAREAIDQVGLKDKYRSSPSQLSGGEQQRIAIARAIAGKPEIIFADEPTANLDSTSGRSIIDLLTKLHFEGQTIVMITHEVEYTSTCDRIIYLEDGLIIDETIQNNNKAKINIINPKPKSPEISRFRPEPLFKIKDYF